MNIDAEINTYLSKLSESEKFLLLDLMKKLSDADIRLSIAKKIIAYNNELEEAVHQIKSGNFIDHKDVLKESDEWQNKKALLNSDSKFRVFEINRIMPISIE